MKYRDKQLLKLREEVLDLDDLGDSVLLTEFTLDDFRIELMKYIEANRAALEDAPFGLYSVVPPSQEYKAIAPGVIFCLRQSAHGAGVRSFRELNYRWDQSFKTIFPGLRAERRQCSLGFAQPKQILEVYRLLCSGKSAPYSELCNLFDQEPDHGKKMDSYGFLLRKAVDAIAVTFRKRVATGLLSSRELRSSPLHKIRLAIRHGFRTNHMAGGEETMNDFETKQAIVAALKKFPALPLGEAASGLLGVLGYTSKKRLALKPNTLATFLATFSQGRSLNDRYALPKEWKSVDFLFQITDEEIRAAANMQFEFESKGAFNDAIINSYLFIAIELKGGALFAISSCGDHARGQQAV